MKEGGKQQCRAFRFTLTAVSFGEDVDDALCFLLEGLRESPEEHSESGIAYECLDYVYIAREDLVGEA